MHLELPGKTAHSLQRFCGILLGGATVVDGNTFRLNRAEARIDEPAPPRGLVGDILGIRIDGAGLDATQTDYTDLIARSMAVNAGIWANQLQVTTGANTVSADHTEVAAAPAAAGAAPHLALDVGQLGGMYAGKILLVGTEHGVGVRALAPEWHSLSHLPGAEWEIRF